MQVLVTGSRGLLGSAVVALLSQEGHHPVRLVRSRPSPSGSEVLWDPESGTLDTAGIEGMDAVVHLAGEPIATGRWTLKKQSRIHDSRVNGTRALARALARLSRPPKALISASAVGYYGDRGQEPLDENSRPGSGFLAEVCQAWEAATGPALERGIRVACLRFGVILSPSGGALKAMLPVFRLGLGGRLGSGRQWMSWVTLQDAAGAVLHAMEHAVSGPVNVVSPRPVTNREFTAALAAVLGRPAVLPAPAWALRLALGAMAEELLLGGSRVAPGRLQETGYVFLDSEIEPALRRILSGAAPTPRRQVDAPVA